MVVGIGASQTYLPDGRMSTHQDTDWFVEFFALQPSLIISGRYRLVTVCTHGNCIVLGHQTVGTMTQYHIQSHYPDTELTN